MSASSSSSQQQQQQQQAQTPLFKKFGKEDVGSSTQMKSSAGRAIRAKLIEHYPNIEKHIDEIIPKSATIYTVKCHNYCQLISVNGEVIFFNERDGPYIPTLRLLHKYPDILVKQQVDRGAIPFVMRGVNIMCPGLTSRGAVLVDAPVGTVVAVMAEGKEHALAIGSMKLSSENVKKVNKGIGIETIHFLNDGLWTLKPVEP